MKLTKREDLLLRRALDKATTPAEAETAAKAFIASLRARGINGYDIVAAARQTGQESPPGPSTATPADPFAGWPNQWHNAEAQASEEAQAAAWQAFNSAQAQAQNTAWEAAWQAGAQAADVPGPKPHPEPAPKQRWWFLWSALAINVLATLSQCSAK